MSDDHKGPCGEYCAVVDECQARGDEIAKLRADLAAAQLVAKDNLDWFNSLKVDYDEARADLAAANARAERHADALNLVSGQAVDYKEALAASQAENDAAAVRELKMMAELQAALDRLGCADATLGDEWMARGNEIDKLVEKVARAMTKADGIHYGNKCVNHDYHLRARAAIEAMKDELSAPVVLLTEELAQARAKLAVALELLKEAREWIVDGKVDFDDGLADRIDAALKGDE